MKLTKGNITLAFEAPHEYAGLEVELRKAIPLELLFAFQEVAEKGLSRDTIERFAKEILVGWNLEDDAGPVPATCEGLMRQDIAFVNTIVLQWQRSISEPSAPLGGDSPSGEPSPAASAVMAVS